MRASRLLSIQMLLETRGRMSAPELARALEVSERTLYRDIDQLTAAGVPVYAERGRSGGFQLLPGWKTSLTGFTPQEAEAVFLGGLAGPAAELGLEGELRSAQLKLLAALPSGWRDQAQRVSTRLHLDPVDWYREAEPPRHLSTVATAVWDGRQLAMHYASWKRSSRQVVQPLGLVLKAGLWYLVAMREKEPRTFRVASIESAEVLPGAVRRPKAFDLAAYWAESVRRFESELHAGTAEVAVTARGLAHLRQLSGPVMRALQDVASPEEGQRITVSVPVEADEQAAAQLLRLAPEVEVLGPARLREAVVRRLEVSAATYGLEAVLPPGHPREGGAPARPHSRPAKGGTTSSPPSRG
jgi:predicted DNA-binding transcriptional regulator YafY